MLYHVPVSRVGDFAHSLPIFAKNKQKTHQVTVMKLRLPHKFQAALLAAIASVSFTTLSTGTLGAAFFVSGHAFAEDAEEEPSATIDIGDTNLDAQAAMEEEEGTAEKEPGSAPINEAGSNGGPGNNAGLLITESDDIDETALDTVVSSEPVAVTSGSADSTPSDDLGFTSNPYATGSDTSNGSDDFSLTGTAPAAAYVPGQTGISAEEGDSAAGTGSGSSTNKTTTGAIGSIGGIGSTGSGAIGGSVARPMALTASNLGSPVSSLSVGGTSLGGDSSSASPELALPATLGDAGSSAASPITTLGNIMYIGDSITNGHNNRISWRWDMFKLLTDNGVTQVEEGIRTGRNSDSSDHVGATYGGSTFANLHSAHSSGRAWEISGRKSGGRYDNSNIMNWLGQSGTKTNGQPYTGNVYSDTAPNATGGAPDTFVMMIGINDFLSDGFNNEYDVHHNLLGYNQATDSFDGKLASGSGTCDYDVIYNSMRTANPDAVIYISKLTPEGSSGNCSSAKFVDALNHFNNLLVRWAAEKNAKDGQHIVVLDPNAGIVDVTNSLVGTTSGTVVPGLGNPAFYDDGLHPSVQGELIISGNIAKGMGLGGRTAGQYRKAATDFSQQISAVPEGATNVSMSGSSLDFGAAGASSATFAWDSADLSHGSTVEFSLLLGNGETGGWDTTTDFAITLDDGSHAGTLNINEAYIKWGSKLLYSQDASLQGNDAIRIAYVNGNAAESLDGGFYVWLGDMMIGEALSSSSSTAAGVTMSYSGSGTALVSSLAMEGTGSFAPNTSRSYNADYAFISAGNLDTKNTSQGEDPSITWSATASKFALPSGQSSTDPTLYREFADTIGAAYTGAANAPYTGSIGMRYCGTGNQDAQQGVLSVFTATVTGDVRMQFDSPNTVYGSWTSQTAQLASVVGTYNGNITGSYTAVFNAGTFQYNIYGGSHTGNTRIDGGTHLFINDGTYNANIYGGSRVASTIGNGTAVTITGGQIAGSVYGGGLAGSITGGTSVTVTGGFIAGDVYGGMAGETDGLYTGSVTVQDNLAVIQGNIYAAEVTFKDISAGTSKYSPAHYAGQINATDTFNLDHYTAEDISAAIVTKNLVLKNGTKTTIRDLTLTACTITVEDTSEGTIAGTLTLGNTATYTGDLTLAEGLVIDMSGSGSGSVYSDGENGFREASEITVMQRGTSGSLTVDPTKLTGAGSLLDSTFNYDSSAGTLTAAISGETGTYFVNSGTVVYGGPKSAKDITTATKVQMQPTVGATLELAENLSSTTCTDGIVVASSAVNPVVKIDKFESDGTTRIVLDQADLHANAAVKLAGDGTFALAANSFVLPEHVSLDSDWAGIIRVSTTSEQKNFILSDLANANSWIEFNGVTGWTNNWKADNSQNIILTDKDGTAAWTNGAFSTSAGDCATFSGKWSGTGTFKTTCASSPRHMDYKYTGDISGWTGTFNKDGAAETDLIFAGQANVINANLVRTNGTLRIDVETDAVFNGDITNADGLTVANGKHATFNGTTSISGASTIGGTVYNGGTMTLGGTVNVDLSNPSAFELYNAGTGGNTYSNGDSGFLTSDSVHYYLVKEQNGGTLSGTPTVTGSSIIDSSQEGNSLVISAQKDSGLYYVNRDLSYDSTEMAAATGFVIKKDTTLSAVNNSALGGSAKQLHGEGKYALASATKTLNGNLTLGTDWTGSVVLSGTGFTDLGLNYAAAGTANALATSISSIELKGVTGWMQKNHNANIILTNPDDSTSALKLTNGSSGTGGLTTFSGSISGSGDFEHAWNKDNVYFELQGDLSQWTGDIIKSAGGSTHFTLKNNPGDTIAVGAKGNSGTLNINVTNSSPVTLTGSFVKGGGTLNVNVNDTTQATFTGDITNANLSVNNGATATLKAASALGSLAGAGTLVVDSGSDAVTLSGSGGHTGSIDVVTGTLDVRSVNAMGSGHVTVQDGATVDLQQSGMSNDNVVAQMGSGQISGGGDVLVSNTGEFVFSGNGTTNLTANYVFTGANAPEFNGHGYDSDGHTLNIGGENTTASITTQTSDLRVESELKARVLEGGALTVAGNLILGHNTATNPGMLEIAGGDVKVAGINLVNTTNSLTMTDGTFEVTNAGNAFTGNSTGNNTVELTGGTLKATQNSWTLNHNATLGDIGVETSAGNTLTIGASGLTTTLTGIIDNSGTLALAGTMNVTKDADEGSTGERYSEGDNGFLITGSSSYTLVSGNTGASQLTADGVEWQINGTAATGATLENGVLVTAGTQGTEYFVNSGDVVYKDSSNHTGEAAGLTLNGGNLIVNEALNSGVRISVAAEQATPTTSGLTVGGSVSLNQDSFGTVAGDFNLTGTVSVGLNTLNNPSTAGSALMQHAQGGTLYLNSLNNGYYAIADSATAATGTLKSGLGSSNVVDLARDWDITSFEKVSIENGKNLLFRMSNAARTVSMETLEVDTAANMGLFGTADSYGGTFNVGNLAGNGNLVLKNGSGAGDKTATFNLGNGEGTNSFSGSIELTTEHPRSINGQVTKVVLNDATVAAGADIQFNVSADSTAALEVATDTSVKGINDKAATGTRTIAATGDGTRSLAVTGEGSYSTAASVGAGLGIAMTGKGSQSFTGDLSAMNGAVTATAGTLTLDNSGSTGSLASATVNGGTLVLDNMDVTNAVTLSSGKLDLMSATNIGSLSMTGGTLVMDGQDWLTTTGDLAFTSGSLDLTGLDIQEGQNYTLATTEGGNLTLGSVGFTLSDSTLKDQYTLQKQGDSLVLTFTPVTEELIWDNHQETGKWDSGDNWHAAATPDTHVPFTEEANVRFTTGYTNTVALNDDVTAGSMVVDSGVTATVDTSGNTLSVTSLTGTSATKGGNVVKTGEGTMQVDGLVNLTNLKVESGKAVLNSTAGGHIDTLELSDASGTADLTNTSFNFTNGGQSIKGNVTIGQGAVGTVTGTDSWQYSAGSDITVTVDGGTLDFGNNRWTVQSHNKLVLNNATVTGAGQSTNGALDFYGSGNSLTSSGSSVVSANIRFRNNTTELAVTDGTLTLSGTLNGGGGINKTGDGMLVLSGTNSYTGATTVSNGTLELADTVTGLGGNLSVLGDGALTLNRYNDAAVSVAGNLTLDGGSTLDLTSLVLTDGTPSYTLATATGNVNLNAGVNFTLNPEYETSDYLLESTGSSLVLTYAPAEEVIWDNNATDNMWTVSENWHTADAPEDHIAFAKGYHVRFTGDTPNATPTLGADAIVRTMTIDSGVGVTVNGDGYKLAVDTIAGAGASLNLNGGTVSVGHDSTVGSLSGNAALQIASGATLTVGGAGDASYSGAISGGGSLTKTGSDTLTLSGNNNDLTGSFIIDEGTVKMGTTTALGRRDDNRTIQVNGGATLDYNGVNADASGYKVTLNGGTLTNTSTGRGSGSRQVVTKLVLMDDSYVKATNEMGIIGSTYAPTSIEMGGNTLEKTGNNTFYLTNTTISGGGTIKVSQGSVNFNQGAGDNQLGSLSSNLELAGGNVGGNKINLGTDITVTGTGNGGTVSAAIIGAHGITKAGDGSVTLSAANTYTGGTTISAGTLVASNAGALGSGAVTLDSGTLDLTTAVSAGALTMNGGTLVLDGENWYTANTGDITLTGATLDLTGMNLSSGASSYTLATATNGTVSSSGVTFTLDSRYDPDLYSLEVQDNSLVLTFTQPEPGRDLIWDGSNSTWASGSSEHWYVDGSEQPVAFKNYDNAIFDSASADATATMSGNVRASAMTVARGADVTIVTSEGNTLTVTGGITVEQGGVLAQQGTGLSGTLQGAGTYDLTGRSLRDVALGDDWTGAVRIKDQSDGSSDAWMNALSTSKSWLELSGFTGYDRSWASSQSGYPDLTANIRLTDSGNNPAWVYTANAGAGQYSMYATGKWEGDGEFRFTGGNWAGVKFTGDISGWNGKLTSTATDTRQVVFAGEADTVNVAIEREGSGALNVIVGDGSEFDATFSNTVNASSLTVSNNATATLEGKSYIDTLMVNDNATATLQGVSSIGTLTLNATATATLEDESSIGTLAGAGNLVVDSGNSIVSLNGTNSYTGSVDVQSGTLDLTSTVGTGDLALAEGATLKFAGAGMLSTGALTLDSGSILDVSDITFSGTHGSVILASTTGSISDTLDDVRVDGLEEGVTYTLSAEGNNLVLNYVDSRSTLIWRGATNNVWSSEDKSTGENKNWYSQDNVWTNVPFTDYDRVRFQWDASVELGSDVNSGRVIVDRGRTVTVDTNKHNFTVADIEGTEAGLKVIGSADKTTNFNGEITLKDLTLDGGTAAINDYANVTGKLTVKNGADVTTNSYVVADTLEITGESSVDLAAPGSNIQNTKVTDSTLTVEAASLLGNLTLADSTVTNTADLQLTTAELRGTNSITGNGSISTEAINLAPSSVTTIDGGQTISLTSGGGISAGIGGDPAELNLGDVTLTGTSSWSLGTGVQVNLQSTTDNGTVIDTNGRTISVDAVLSGEGNLTKEGAGTLVLSGDNSTFTGNTTVSDGALRVNSANALVSSASVNVEDGATLWLSKGQSVTLGDTTIADGATLRLAGENLLDISSGNTLTLANNSTLDVSNITLTPGVAKDYVLASGTVDYGDLSTIQLTFEHGVHPAPGTTATLEYKDNQLVLHYTLNQPAGLIWDGGTGVWDVENTQKWHGEGADPGTSTFSTYDDVTFKYNGTNSIAQVNRDNVHASTMTVKAGDDADHLNVVELNVGSGKDANVDFLVAEEYTQVKKTGAGSATIGVADEAFGADMTVSNGTLTAQYVDMLDNNKNISVTGDLIRTGGTMNVLIGDGYQDTFVTFEEGTNLSNVSRIETLENGNVEFKGTTTIHGNGGTPTIIAADGTTISFTGATTVTTVGSDQHAILGGDGSIHLGDNTTFSLYGGSHFNLNDAVQVTIDKLDSKQDLTFVLEEDASLTIKDVYMTQKNGEQVLYSGFWITPGETERQHVTIDTIYVDGTGGAVKAVGSISSRTLGRTNQQPGDFYVDKLICVKDGDGKNIPATFMLSNYVRPDYSDDVDVAEVLHLGGSGESDFTGTLMVSDWNRNGTYSGLADQRKNTVIVLCDNTVASDAVIDFNVKGSNSDFGLGINSDHVKVLGINGLELPGDDTFLVFSGTMDTALHATSGSDNTVRTLEITGDDDYQSCATVDKNLNLVKNGDGTQTFTGQTDRFDGSIDIENGTLEFAKANSTLTVEDLTLAANPADATKADVDHTLRVRNAGEPSTVGTVEVNGTLLAHGAGQGQVAALDANLTLGQDAVLDVHETLTRVDNTDPEMEGHADYFGGLNMLGNSLTLTGQSVLSDADLARLMGLKWGDHYDLAFNVSSLTLDGVTYTDPIEFVRDDYEHANIDASLFFSNLQAEDYYICYSGAGLDGPGGNVGVFYIFKAPEPTTSTLSLLALAALAARRRRKG